MVLDVKSSQEYPVNARDPQGTILGRGLFLLYISDLPGDVIWDIALYVDDSTLYSNCNQAADLWQQLELTSELEPDLWDTVYWGRKWLVDFNAGKTQPFLFDQSNTLVRLMWKCNGSVLEEILGLTFWNTVVTPGLVPLVTTWNCWTSCKNEYAGMVVLHLLLLLNPWLIVEMWQG